MGDMKYYEELVLPEWSGLYRTKPSKVGSLPVDFIHSSPDAHPKSSVMSHYNPRTSGGQGSL